MRGGWTPLSPRSSRGPTRVPPSAESSTKRTCTRQRSARGLGCSTPTPRQQPGCVRRSTSGCAELTGVHSHSLGLRRAAALRGCKLVRRRHHNLDRAEEADPGRLEFHPLGDPLLDDGRGRIRRTPHDAARCRVGRAAHALVPVRHLHTAAPRSRPGRPSRAARDVQPQHGSVRGSAQVRPLALSTASVSVLPRWRRHPRRRHDHAGPGHGFPERHARPRNR